MITQLNYGLLTRQSTQSGVFVPDNVNSGGAAYYWKVADEDPRVMCFDLVASLSKSTSQKRGIYA
jgi:hypothetical protein